MEHEERIIVIPKELQEQVKADGVEEEFNAVIEKLQNGELVGDIMDIEYCDVQMRCGDCGSNNIKWVLDKASNEVLYNCKSCKNRGWMYKSEYDEAVKEHPEVIIKK